MTGNSDLPQSDDVQEVEAIPVADSANADTVNCAECGTNVPADLAVRTENATFCGDCFATLTRAVEEALADQSRGINYGGAVLGGALGGMLGAAVWWGFTTLTNIQFGLVAVVIGWGVGKGVTIMSGHKRALSLQLISVLLAAVSYGLATYWVFLSAFRSYVAENNLDGSLPFLPTPELFIEVFTAGFEMFDLIFLAIVLWQAWKIPAPISLNTGD